MRRSGISGRISKKYKVLIFVIVILLVGIILFIYYPKKSALTIKETAGKYAKQCEEATDFRRCYSPLFKNLATQSTVDETLAILKETQSIDHRINDCHYVAHDIVSALYDRFPAEWVQRINTIDLNWCSTGFLHGTILKLNLDKEEDQIQVNELDKFCKKIIEVQQDKRQMDDSCYHAAGHVFLIEKVGNIEQGLEVCSLFDAVKKRQDCSIGLFMETVQRDALVEHGLMEKNTWTWDEMEKQEVICRNYSTDPVIARACWMEIWPLYKANAKRIPGYEGNLKALYTLCGRTGEAKAQDRCYQYGIYTTTDNGLGFLSNDDIEHSCDVYRGDLLRLTECIKYLGPELIRSNAVKEARTVSKFCTNAVSNDKQKCCKYFQADNKQQLQHNIANIQDSFEACMLDGGKLKTYHEL